MIREIFSSTYLFHGKHATMARELVDRTGNKLFDTYIDLFINAAMVGIALHKKGIKEKGNENTTKIPFDVINKRMPKIWLLVQLAVLTDSDLNLSKDDRLEALYRHADLSPEYVTLFESFMLGGLEFLHERLYTVGASELQQATNIGMFLDDIDENPSISSEEIIELVRNGDH